MTAALVLLLTACPQTVPPPTGEHHAVHVAIVGEGRVTSEPAGIDCPAACTAELPDGAEIRLIAHPGDGHTFDGWYGDHDCADGSVLLDVDHACTAVFAPTGTPSHLLELAVVGDGHVTSTPPGIDCPDGACFAVYPEGTDVALDAHPGDGSVFDTWTGDPDCVDGQVALAGPMACTAVFVPVGAPHHLLDVGVVGQGRVTSAPPGIDCPDGDCATLYPEGTTVTLTTAPAADHAFAGWSGDPDCSDGQVTMATDVVCTATFAPTVGTHTLTVTKSGQGTVTSAPAGISCGSACTATFTDGTSVALAATPAGGATFTGWTGDPDCSDGHVTMSGDRTCHATFEEATGFVAIAGGGTHSLALDPRGHAWGWGDDAYGQVGDGSTGAVRATPTAVVMPAGITFTAISAGGLHSLALDQNGRAWAWGNDTYGQIGDGSTGDVRWAPTQVQMPAGVTFTTVSAGGFHSLALDQNGHAWAWGMDIYGQVGDGTTAGVRWAPTAVVMPAGVRFVAIGAGWQHSLALDQNGHAWAWGWNHYGQVGDGTTGEVRWAPTAVLMPSGTTFTRITAGGYHCLALDPSGQAWGWGSNDVGQVGDGTATFTRWAPTAVRMPTDVTFTAISGGWLHTLALDPSGRAWAWGWNEQGQIGDGTTGTMRWAPTAVLMPAGTGFASVSAGGSHSLALDPSANGWAWGASKHGQLGNGSASPVGFWSPVAVLMP